MYGASPGECEFARATGQIRIVDCTHNKVLGPLPKPSAETPPAQWYSPQIKELVGWILTQDRHARPTLAQVRSKVQMLLQRTSGGLVDNGGSGGGGKIFISKTSDVDVESQEWTKSVL